MSQPNKDSDKARARRAGDKHSVTSRKKWPRILGILLGTVLAISCRYVPAEYETACKTVAEIATLSCGG